MKSSTLFKLSFFILTLIGILMIYSASSIWAEYKMGNQYYYLIRQIIYFSLSLIIYFLFSKVVSYQSLYKNANWIFIVSLILLVLVLIPGIGFEKNGSRSWIGIGILSFQPSELMKVSLIVLTSKLCAKEEGIFEKTKYLIVYLIIILLVFGLIMLEPDFGTGAIILLSIFFLIFKHLIKLRWIFVVILLGFVGAIILVIIAPYRLERIESYIDPFKDPLGSGFQMIQSLYALAPSGFFGYGLFKSKQKFFYLPEPQTDFIFAIIVEELGMLGGLFVIVLFSLMIFIGYRKSIEVEEPFGSNLLYGFASLFLVQVFINIGVVIGLLPVTGVTLPLISYGGTSLFTSYFILGLMSQIYHKNNVEI